MDSLALFVWIVAAAVALPMARDLALGNPVLGAQVPVALGGLCLSVLFLALGGPSWAAWVAAALAGVGLIADTRGAAWVVSDERPVSPMGQAAEERAAFLLSIQLPMLCLALVFSVAMGLDVANLA